MDLNTMGAVLPPRRTDLAEGGSLTAIEGLSGPWQRQDPPPEVARPIQNAVRDAIGARLTPTPFAAARVSGLVAAASGEDAAWM